MEKGLISVDRWTEGSQVYFLTHLHADHMQGLSSAWARGPLYCSRLTAKLFPFKFPGLNLSLLRVLDVGSWYSISLISPSSGEKTMVEVMAIDAHHCPGSVMLLFRGEFGFLLYTGDFRWETSSDSAKIRRTTLLKALENNVVDTLDLDNTYCNPSFVFPSRYIAAQQVVDLIISHPDHDIIIGIDSLGKEELLSLISHKLNIKIWVWPERLQTMHLLGFHDIFTTKTSLTRVRAVPRYSFSIDTLERLNTIHPTIGIMPSGLPWVVKPLNGDANIFGSPLTSHRSKWSKNGGTWTGQLKEDLGSVKRFHKYIYSVPYSDHSCFTEIQEFISLVQPMNIRGIVSSSSFYVDPLYHFRHLCRANQPSMPLHYWQENRLGCKRVEAVQTKSNVETGRSTDTIRKQGRTAEVDVLGVHVSKVNALRRIKRGAKIVQNESSN